MDYYKKSKKVLIQSFLILKCPIPELVNNVL